MKILLVNPKLPSQEKSNLSYLDSMLSSEKSLIDRFLFENYVKEEYLKFGILKTFHEHSSTTASLGLLSIAAVLEKDGHIVYYHQIYDTPNDDSKLKELILDCDIVGVTAMCTTWYEANDIIKLSKKLKPNVITIIGGPQATYMLDSPLIGNSCIDFVCKGEGDEVIRRFAEAPFSLKNIKEIIGLDYRDGSTIVVGKKAEKLDITKLPIPSYHLVQDSETQMYLQFSKGCENSCAFCCEWEKERHKSYEQMKNELLAIEKFKQHNLIFIIDSNFYGNNDKLNLFKRAVKDSNTTNYFTVQSTITSLRESEERCCSDFHVLNKFLGLENLSMKF